MIRRWVLAALLLAGACGAPPSPSAERLTVTVGKRSVEVRIARRAEERRRGLQGITTLGANEGMLFLYRDPGTRSIWMKDCKIDLDVAFLDEAGRALQVTTLRAPRSVNEEPERIASTQPAVMVLEMPAGWFERHGLGVGTRIVLPPAIDRNDADR